MLYPLVLARIDGRLIFKLVLWSLVVGALLYWAEVSPGSIYGWIFDKLAGVWDWFARSGLSYILLGASIVVPLYLIIHFTRRGRR